MTEGGAKGVQRAKPSCPALRHAPPEVVFLRGEARGTTDQRPHNEPEPRGARGGERRHTDRKRTHNARVPKELAKPLHFVGFCGILRLSGGTGPRKKTGR